MWFMIYYVIYALLWRVLFFNLFYWSIIDLQCWVSFYYTVKWFIYIYIDTHTHSHIYIYRLSRRRSGKESACQCRKHKKRRFSLWVRKIPGEGNGNPLQYSCLQNSMDRGARWATIHEVSKSWTWLSTQMHAHPHTQQCIYIVFHHGLL